MAEQAGEQGKKRRRPKPLPEGVRIYHAPRMSLMRMGKVVAEFRGGYATLDVNAGTVRFERGAQVRVGPATVTAPIVDLHLVSGRMSAEGGVKVHEEGIHLEADSLTSAPSLATMRLGGKVSVKASDKAVAEALLKSDVRSQAR